MMVAKPTHWSFPGLVLNNETYTIFWYKVIFFEVNMLEVILLGVALSMDSLSVSIVNGIKYQNYTKFEMFMASLSFGLFQGLMPLLGYLIFIPFIEIVQSIDHWLVFVILAYLGISMIKEGLCKDKEECQCQERFTCKVLIAESIATAIDALSVGITLPSLALNPYLSCLIICCCTFAICIIGHSFGKKLGILLKDKAMIFGGSILFFIGLKTLLEHLGVF